MIIDPETTILILESHDFQRRILVSMLRDLGINHILEAANGREALNIVCSAPRPPDLVLCGIDMPKTEGIAFIQHLGEAKSGMKVIISALDPALLGSAAKMADAFGVYILGMLEKPVTRARLVQLLAAHQAAGKVRKSVRHAPSVFGLQDIRAGIANNEFEPFFQPKIEMTSGRVVGAEALARWRHPTHGIVPPTAFILELELNKDIGALTFHMLEKAACACRNWLDTGFDFTVSVNLSLTSLANTLFADRIHARVRASGLEPDRMVLEITEAAAMTKTTPALGNLKRLRMHGFGLSIDDYGSGFASMRQLARMPFTELKIDQCFVNGCAWNHAAKTTVKASLALARELGLKTVAEGIEIKEDWDALKAMGCDVAQGYFIAPPMEESAFLEFCRQHK